MVEGRRIKGDFDSIMDVVKALDAEIHGNYDLTPPNKIASNMLHCDRSNTEMDTEMFRFNNYTADDAAKFEKRYKSSMPVVWWQV